MEKIFSQVTVTIPDPDRKLRGDPVLAYFRGVIGNTILIGDMRFVKTRSGTILAMPSRKQSARCDGCEGKCSVDYRFCPWCGASLDFRYEGRIHIDVVHAIDVESRQRLIDELQESYEAVSGSRVDIASSSSRATGEKIVNVRNDSVITVGTIRFRVVEISGSSARVGVRAPLDLEIRSTE